MIGFKLSGNIKDIGFAKCIDTGPAICGWLTCLDRRLHSRFYSVDVVQRTDGQLRVVEVGDGQVSDLVGWTPEQFAKILSGFNKNPSPRA